MQLTQLFGRGGDERAATPVIGIVLMVAIAVILAALIAPELLSLSRNSGETGPSSVIQFDYDTSTAESKPDAWGLQDDAGTPDYDGLLTITHTDGESVPLDRLSLVGVTDRSDLAFGVASGTGLSDGELNSGDELTVWVMGDDTVRVVWDSREGTKTTAIAVWDGA